MPLVAVVDGERLESFPLTADEWSSLRAKICGLRGGMILGGYGGDRAEVVVDE